MQIAINTHTSGKFKRETINSRSHIVTTMRPIRGDIAMNGILYPNDEVKKTFTCPYARTTRRFLTISLLGAIIRLRRLKNLTMGYTQEDVNAVLSRVSS